MAEYVLHRGRRYKVARKFSTRAAADRYSVPRSVVARTPNKRVSAITISYDRGKNKGKFGAAWAAS